MERLAHLIDPSAREILTIGPAMALSALHDEVLSRRPHAMNLQLARDGGFTDDAFIGVMTSGWNMVRACKHNGCTRACGCEIRWTRVNTDDLVMVGRAAMREAARFAIEGPAEAEPSFAAYYRKHEEDPDDEQRDPSKRDHAHTRVKRYKT